MGCLISFEGIDGAGKGTQARLLVEELRLAGIDVVHTHEPGGTPLGQRLRELILDPDFELCAAAELFLLLADRAQHCAEVIAPAIASGRSVICDRYIDSTLAYQSQRNGESPTCTQTFLRRAHLATVAWNEQIMWPARTYLLDIPVEAARERMRARGEKLSRFERLGDEFFENVRHAYGAIALAHQHRVMVLDGRLSPEVLARCILEDVRRYFGEHFESLRRFR